MKIKKLLLLLLLIPQLHTSAQTAQLDSIDAFITKNLERYSELPGLAITIVKDDKPIFTKSYGLADVENNTPSTTNTPYYIASVTKTFLGVLAAQLEAEGILKLEAPITDYAPVKNFQDQTLFEGVTIGDLLTHTSGIANVPLGWVLTQNGAYEQEDLIRLLEKETVSRYNRKAYAYDNFGYHVFALILRAEFDMDWKTLLKEWIFDPAGMTQSSANTSDVEKNAWSFAMPYTSLNDDRSPSPSRLIKNDKAMHAAGGLISSIEDMQKWLLLNMNAGRLNGRQVLPAREFEKAHTEVAKLRGNNRSLFQDSGYGLGWNLGTYNKRSAIYHSGGFEGYYALVSYLPEDGLGISIMVNETHFGDNIGNLIVSYAYDLLLGEVSSSAEYDQKQEQVDQQVSRLQRAFAADRQRRKTREWKLSTELRAYTGEYYNEELGLMKVSLEEGSPQVSIGISNATGTESSQKDAMRVEFRDGRAEEILFVIKRKKSLAAVYRNRVFLKQ